MRHEIFSVSFSKWHLAKLGRALWRAARFLHCTMLRLARVARHAYLCEHEGP